MGNWYKEKYFLQYYKNQLDSFVAMFNPKWKDVFIYKL